MSTVNHNLDKKVWRKLSHQRLVATIVMLLTTLHGLTPKYLQS